MFLLEVVFLDLAVYWLGFSRVLSIPMEKKNKNIDWLKQRNK